MYHPESDHPPSDHDEIQGQGKIDDQKISRWLKIGDSVEDGENSHPGFKGILLITGGHPDEPVTWDERVEETSQVHSNAPSEDPERGES